MNAYEKAAMEWLKGCSCSDKGAPETCAECTAAYRKHLTSLLAQTMLIDSRVDPWIGDRLQGGAGPKKSA